MARILSAMMARVQLELVPGVSFTLSDQLLMAIAVVLLLIGLALAFAGRSVWRHVMSFIGGIVGGLLGFTFGSALGGSFLVGFIAGFVGAMIGSSVFIFLARLGISALAGVLGFLVVTSLLPSVISGASSSSLNLAALVIGLIVFVVTFVYAEVAIGVVTAIAGGLLAGFALILLGVSMTLSVLALLAIIVFGAALQLTVLKEESERKKMSRTIAHPSVVASAVSPPVAPAMPGRTCPRCGGQLDYIPEYNRYYCLSCQKYE
jgi:Na+-transporting methylmalonyl-CoA/oxaloacetate decarboxylase gamma subunit